MRASVELNRIKSRIFAPSPKEEVWRWVGRNCVIPAKSGSQYTGPLDVERTPFFKEIYNWWQDPKVRKIYLVACTQVGKTLTSYGCIAHSIKHSSHPILYATSNEVNARRVSDNELIPFLRECKDVAPLFSKNRYDNKKLEVRFLTCLLRLTGSNSPPNLASAPACYVICDETDKWPEAMSGEARAIDLIEARTHSFRNKSKILAVSTPTIPNGNIWKGYLSGNQVRIHVPCPKCLEFQELQIYYSKEHGGITWPNDCRRSNGSWNVDAIQNEVYYECKYCKDKIKDTKREWMVSRYKPYDENPEAPYSIKSMQVSAAYSSRGWAKIASDLVAVENGEMESQHFQNSSAALPYLPSVSNININTLRSIQAKSINYDLGELPFKPHVIVMGIDIQLECCFWCIRAYDKDKRSALIDYGQCLELLELLDIFETKYSFEGENFNVFKAYIDSGYRTHEVYRFIRNFTGRAFIPTKGSHSGLVSNVFKWSDNIIFEGRKINLLQYDDSILKENLYKNISLSSGDWMLPQALNKDYYDQLTSEVMIGRTNDLGHMVYEWKVYGRAGNHLADCEKACLLLPIVNSNIFI